ncbi:hypothetical protein GPZ77_02670 [Streptomyces sp. QHH-9511]|nr:hypothetical protein GPZ77_02670 [Streptomyces sp. QHH-9511]
MVIAPDSPSRLLGAGQCSRCRECGNKIEWHNATGHGYVSLHPGEVPSVLAPADHRWHLASGVAHPTDGGGRWCRLAHVVLCPARAEPGTLHSPLEDLRRCLALNTRRLTDTGAFVPLSASETKRDEASTCRPLRPVVQLLYTRYIGAVPIEDIQCVAQTTRQKRCTHHLLSHGTPGGHWTLMPASPHRRGHQRLDLPAPDFAVYDLGRLPYSEQVRWRTQRCPTHAVTTGAPDLAMVDWELFDPVVHHAHLATRLPAETFQLP